MKSTFSRRSLNDSAESGLCILRLNLRTRVAHGQHFPLVSIRFVPVDHAAPVLSVDLHVYAAPNRTAELNQKYQTYFMSRQQEIVTKIKNYCKEFNKDKKYSYIIAREPGLFYYTDTAYNVTSELLKVLNAFYSKKK